VDICINEENALSSQNVPMKLYETTTREDDQQLQNYRKTGLGNIPFTSFDKIRKTHLFACC